MLQELASPHTRQIAVGVDTGGTHTDVVLINGEIVKTLKVPTTPSDLNVGILKGLTEICEVSGLDIHQLSRFCYATTFVTNLIVEQKGAQIALITTEGFRDVLEIGRASRKPDVYDIHWRAANPLVPRQLRFVVRERMNYAGEVLTELDETQARKVLEDIRGTGVKSLAVCFLHAYANPVHERRIAEMAQEICPEIDISLSSDVVREFREYERTSTTCVNALIKKAITDHLSSLATASNEKGLNGSCYIMRGNGGLSTFQSASKVPAAITHSGIMGGIVGATALARQCGIQNIITLDMGGTSTDVALISNGEPQLVHQSKVGDYPLLIPTLDMVTIGAGGGSIAYIDGGSAMRVGPHSAGSVPGPACYGQGGEDPTVTDANLYTGRLNPQTFLAGARTLYPEKSERAIEDKIAQPLGISSADAALGIMSIAEAHMTNAIKLISVERGLDCRDFTLFAFGGAGALHATRLAEELSIKRVVVPPAPGNLSAMGLLCADVRHDMARTLVIDLCTDSIHTMRDAVEELKNQAAIALQAEGIAPTDSLLFTSIDLRYKGQNYDLNLPLNDSDFTDAFLGLHARFNQQHEKVYGYLLKERGIEAVNLRITAMGTVQKALWPRHAPVATKPVPKTQRAVYLHNLGWETLGVYSFEKLHPEQRIDGPAIIEYPGSTLYLAPNWTCSFDVFKNAHLSHHS